MNKTTNAKPHEVERAWYLVDAANVPIGRLASQVAQILRGKHKPSFSYHVDCGDYVVITNADKAVWTGGKGKELLYWHTGYPGGIRNISREDMLERTPEKVLEKVIIGMLPKGPLGRQMAKKLKVYTGTDHPHGPQDPQTLEISVNKVKKDA